MNNFTTTRRVGIPGTVKWGEHLCAFFYSKTDLLKLVVPYIKAGLEDNSFVCGSLKKPWSEKRWLRWRRFSHLRLNTLRESN